MSADPLLHDWTKRGAILSEDGLYRYALQREVERELRPLCRDCADSPTFGWCMNQPRMICNPTWFLVFCMLNPSTADEVDDDNTIAKCCGFAQRMGFGGIAVVNLFAYRATKVRVLYKRIDDAFDAVGPSNDAWTAAAFAYAARTSGFVVPAWGKPNPRIRARVAHVRRLIDEAAVAARCLGTNKDGSPGHPLMLSYDRDLVPWETR